MTNLATQTDILSVRQDMTLVKQELQTAMDNLGLRLTIRLGVMLAAAVALLGAIVKVV